MAEKAAPEVEQEVEDAIDALTDEEESPDIGDDKLEATVEELAQELGWKPQTDFQGHEDDYVGPGEYIRRSKDIQTSMRKHLKENKTKLASMDAALRDIKVHYETTTKAQEKIHKKQIEALRKQRIEAIEEGDPEKVDAVESEMAELYETASRPMQEDRPQVNPEEEDAFVDWQANNPWYSVKGVGGDNEMTKYADSLADLPENRLLPYERKLNIVTEKVKAVFPEKFKQKSRPGVNPVEGPSPGSNRRKYSARDLSDEQREVMRNFVKAEVMTEKQYIDDLVKQGELR